VTVAIADAHGDTVPRSSQRVRFSLTGPGEIVAVDNGDPTSLEPFQTAQRRAYNGLLLVVVRTHAGKTGRITLRAEAPGLERARVVLQAARS